MATKAVQEAARVLRRQPLIGTTAAAKLLGIKPPNFKRDVSADLIEIPVEGGASVYFRNEVRALARERDARRRAPESEPDAEEAAA